MGRKLSREVMFLILPAVVLAGIALMPVKVRSAVFNGLPLRPFDSGPLRIVQAGWRPIRLDGESLRAGYDWAGECPFGYEGKWTPPTGWTPQMVTPACPTNLRIEYKLGGGWKASTHKPSGGSRFACILDQWDMNILLKADLVGIPANATDVRLRGNIEEVRHYWGAPPGNWISPLKIRTFGSVHQVFIESEPFDAILKGDGI